MPRPSTSPVAHLPWIMLAIASLATACVETEGDDDLAETDVIAKQGINSLDENAIKFFAREMNALITAALGAEPAIEILAKDPTGLKVLDYSLRCALKSTQTVKVKNGAGAIVSLPTKRGIGLAPEWLYRGLDRFEQEWLMGCLLAHINAAGAAVPISLRGGHGALALSTGEAAAFPYLEGAFYGSFGDLLNPDLAFRTRQYACYGPALVAKCGAAAPTVLWKRLCTRGDCNDLTVVGPCEPTQLAPNRACTTRTGDYYKECASRATSGGWPAAGADRYTPAVVTTWLKEVNCNPDP